MTSAPFIEIEVENCAVYRFYGLGRWRILRDDEWVPINGIFVHAQALRVAAAYVEEPIADVATGG